MISFDVPGRPIAQPRARSPGFGRKHYTPDNGIKGYKAHIVMMARRAGCVPLVGRVALEVRFLFARPKSHFTPKGVLRKSALEFPGHDCGDTDNLVKAVKDALNGIAYADDYQVREEHAYVDWHTDDRTVVRIW